MTSRHMQSARELQQLDNWSVNPEIRIAYVSKGSIVNFRWANCKLQRPGLLSSSRFARGLNVGSFAL